MGMRVIAVIVAIAIRGWVRRRERKGWVVFKIYFLLLVRGGGAGMSR